MRLTADERREDIVTHAAQLFASKGFNGTTTKAISDACGISEATIFRHFETKDDLYDAIIRNHVEHEGHLGLTDEVAEGADDRAFFQTFATRFLRHMVQDRVFWRLLLRSALEDHALSRRFFETHVKENMEFLAGHIRRRQELGRLRDMDPALTATFFVGMLAHYVNVTEVFGRDEFQYVSVEQAAAFVVDLFLTGVEAR